MYSSRSFSMQVIFYLSVAFLFSVAIGHGLMNKPNPRGCLSATKNKFIFHTVTEEGSNDFRAHFPAGNRRGGPGGARRYQKAVVAPDPWTPYEPTVPGHRWRFGVCGDKVDGNEHLKDGIYYDNATLVATYRQGGVIDVGLTMVAHHNGFIELHICDVDKCPGGDISEQCFAQGHCRRLMRRRTPICDSGESKECGPIDRNYPGRWYLPCSRISPGKGYETYGDDGTILYQLPEDLVCEHCVIQWYWTAANFCNPPGTVEYFEGPDGPKNWGNCKGQAGSVGGYVPRRRECGTTFPEEYAQCADVRIEPRNGGQPHAGTSSFPNPTQSVLVSTSGEGMPTVEPTYTPPAYTIPPTPDASVPPISEIPSVTTAPRNAPPRPRVPHPKAPHQLGEYEFSKHRRQRFGGVRDIVLVGDGVRILSLNEFNVVDVSRYRHVTIEAIVQDDVKEVVFSIGKERYVDKTSPFFLFGDTNGVPHYEDERIVNKDITLTVVANGDDDDVSIKLLKVFADYADRAM